MGQPHTQHRPAFQQPEGIALAAGALWVANSNAHEIVRVDLTSGACKRIPVAE